MGAVIQMVQLPGRCEPEAWTLEKYAETINRHFDAAARGETACDRARLKAGVALIHAREKVPKGEWGRWCDANINRSRQDIARVMKMAGCEDPEAALVEEREKTAARVRGIRAAQHEGGAGYAPDVTYVRDIEPLPPPIHSHVRAVVSAYLSLSVEQRAQFRAEIDHIDGIRS